MARVIATINLKGGVGKTTVTAATAEFMAGLFGQRVLLIDLDSQINLTTMMIGEDAWVLLNNSGRTLADAFRDAVEGTAVFDTETGVQRDVSPVRQVSGVDLLPSSLDLIELQEQVAALHLRSGGGIGAMHILRDAIAPVLDYYDYVLIDCPPNVGPITRNGLAIADAYIMPTIPDVLSTYGIPQIQKLVAEFGGSLGRQIVELGLVITKFKANSTVHKTIVRNLRRDPTIQNVLPTYLREANAISAAAEYRDYSTLRNRYGNQGQYEELESITRHIMTEAEGKL